MDKATSVLAAINAGKLPSTEQASQAIDWFIQEIIPQARPGGNDELSAQGRVLAADSRTVLEAYKQFLVQKNDDNLIQQALWHLNEADLSDTSTNVIDTNEANGDMKKLRSSLRTVIEILWTNTTSQGSSLFEDFASFSRLALANAAEAIEGQAGSAKDKLREIDSEVQEGDRDAVGRKRRRLEEEKDPKVAFEHGMDTLKDAGVSVIGTAQDASQTVEENAQKANNRVRDAYFQICDRAQSDPKYHDAISTLFDTVQKWVTRSLDTASDVNKGTDLESFVDDPTPEQHVPKALRGIGSFIERLAGGKPLDDLYAKIRACVVDIRQDDDLQTWFNQFFEHLRKSVDEPGYARSDEATQRRKLLKNKWEDLKDETSESGKKWQADWAAFKEEWTQFQSRIANDKDLNRIHQAHTKLGQDIERGLVETGSQAASTGIEAAMQQASWFWQDIFKVYAPKFIDLMKGIPIPRTEYKDAEVEFVLENVDISSFKLLPAHIYIRNITDVDIKTTETSSQTAVGTLTRISAQGVQMHLKDVSFWYKDKTASIGPSEHSGLLGFKLPEKGIDIDMRIRLIPSTPPGEREGERERRRAFHTIETVSVNVSEDIELEVKESNHSILVSVFKPILVSRFREALARTLAEQTRAVLESGDALAWDIGSRSEVFADTGLGAGPAMIAAVWSEIGHYVRNTDAGWRATGTGIVREAGEGAGSKGEGASFAMGAEPQILSGEKRGPLGTGSEPLAQKAQRLTQQVKKKGQEVADEMDVDLDVDAEDAKGAAKELKDQAKELVVQGKHTVESFARSVDAKAEQEKAKPGWKSSAYDISV
ncbi:hypothetical protein HGRIS_014759 [Hohenbuehelia grisea]|uniref:Uncharacterized protein n=1 Tax=Hohenbuehelia grisea TaxID=104357 RepID=A0ABR3IQP3_9AGAR